MHNHLKPAQAFRVETVAKTQHFSAVLYPTPWQRKTLWNAITCVALLVIAGSVICTVYVATRVLLFLQPLLLPVAVAGVLAYLLEPLVTWLARRGLPRLIAVIIVFALFIMSGALLLLGIGPNIYNESQKFSNALPGYFERSWSSLDNLLRENLEKLPQIGPHPAIPAPNPSGTAPSSAITSKRSVHPINASNSAVSLGTTASASRCPKENFCSELT